MMNKIEHIGIAVRSLEVSIPVYEKLLGTGCYKREKVDAEQVETAFFKVGESKIELLQCLTGQGVISRFIEKKGEGLHHIAYAVNDIHAAMKQMRSDGFNLLSDVPKKGADNKLICFVHPKDAAGVLVELCAEDN